MKTSFEPGSEKMPTVLLEQPETNSQSRGTRTIDILELVHKPPEYNNALEQNYSGTIQLKVTEPEQGREEKAADNLEDVDVEEEEEENEEEGEEQKGEWSLKYVPEMYNNDKLNDFSCRAFQNRESDSASEKMRKIDKRGHQRKHTTMQVNYENEDTSPADVFLSKQQTNSKGKKCLSKLKEKINGIKKGYKPIAPYLIAPEPDDKLSVGNPVERLVHQQVNPILIVKINDQPLTKDKPKMPEYLECSYKKDDSNYVHSYSNFDSLPTDPDLKDKKKFVTKTKCYKCYNCPFTTLNRDFLNYHIQKKQKCFITDEVFHCPACKNVFYSFTPLRVHLVHDHKMLSKEVKVIMQSMQEASFGESEAGGEDVVVEKEKSSCIFQSGDMPSLKGSVFGANMGSIEMSLPSIDPARDEMEKNFEDMSNKHLTESRNNLGPCGGGGNGGTGSGKRQTMLESYLDDINSKGNCNLPPTLNHNGSALLENTFNFTAPVSEQLPSIQPPPAHSSSISPMDQSHLLVEQQNHGFIGMANVFDTRDQTSFKPSDTHHYSENDNMILPNGNYLSSSNMSHMQDIPVINLDENNLEKSSSNILSHDINIDDFPTYHENGLTPLETPESVECPIITDDDDQGEKKKLKKLGVGYRCDINGCKVRLQSEKNIQYHRRCHEGTLYNCPECCKDCSTWVSLSSHLWQAHKIDMELYKCDQCPYKTPSYSRLTNIHRGIHGKARPFLCDICGKGFKTVKQMRNHKNIHKAKMVRMSVCHCEICGRTVADKRQLELHINNTHKKKKPYLCYICGYASAVKHSLVVHMRRHTGEKPYQCEKCEYKTADHNALRRHKMKHSGVRSYKCNHCNYTCIQASTYKVHIKTKHPGLEADVIFSCGQCNFQTLNRGSYLSHTSEHENFNGQIRKPTRCLTSKPDVQPSIDYYGDANRMDLVGPIISERVVETIVDLSGAHTLLEDDYYNVERITGDLEEGPELKFKTPAMT